MRADRKSKPQHKMIFALFAQRKEGFPSGGRKLQAVCRRRRLMRGDQSPLTQRLQSLALPPPQNGRDSRTLQQLHTSPNTKKLPPCPRLFQKANRIFASKAAGAWGKFGEDEGGLEGEGTPSERGFLLPPRSIPYPISPHSTRISNT